MKSPSWFSRHQSRARHGARIEAHFGRAPAMVWHADSKLLRAPTLVVVPGASPTAIIYAAGRSRRAPIMTAVRRTPRAAASCSGSATVSRSCARRGSCGRVMRNAALKFICRDVHLRGERSDTPFTRGYNAGQVIRVPVAHGEAITWPMPRPSPRLECEGGCCSATPRPTARWILLERQRGDHAIAGVVNEAGNVSA